MELSLLDLEKYARDFVARLPARKESGALVFGLTGELGAGKTTFVQAVARALGVKEPVTSPTFVIAQRYATTHPVFKKLVHMDAYRLRGEMGDTIGFSEYTHDPESLVLVEWPENLPSAARFPMDAPTIMFETIDERTRRITEHV